MKKIYLLLLMLIVGIGSTWAQPSVVTSVMTGMMYTLKCQGDHNGLYLAESSDALEGHATTPTFFEFETGSNGGYYIKSYESGNYLKYASTSQGAEVSLVASTEKTEWYIKTCTSDGTELTNKVVIAPASDGNQGLNNKESASGATNNLRIYDAKSSSNGCSIWTLTEYVKPVSGRAYGLVDKTSNLYVDIFNLGKEDNDTRFTQLATLSSSATYAFITISSDNTKNWKIHTTREGGNYLWYNTSTREWNTWVSDSKPDDYWVVTPILDNDILYFRLYHSGTQEGYLGRNGHTAGKSLYGNCYSSTASQALNLYLVPTYDVTYNYYNDESENPCLTYIEPLFSGSSVPDARTLFGYDNKVTGNTGTVTADRTVTVNLTKNFVDGAYYNLYAYSSNDAARGTKCYLKINDSSNATYENTEATHSAVKFVADGFNSDYTASKWDLTTDGTNFFVPTSGWNSTTSTTKYAWSLINGTNSFRMWHNVPSSDGSYGYMGVNDGTDYSTLAGYTSYCDKNVKTKYNTYDPSAHMTSASKTALDFYKELAYPIYKVIATNGGGVKYNDVIYTNGQYICMSSSDAISGQTAVAPEGYYHATLGDPVQVEGNEYSITVNVTDWTAEELIDDVNSNTDYILAKNFTSNTVGVKPYAETKALTDAITAETRVASTIKAAYVAFKAADKVTLESGHAYRLISAYSGFTDKKAMYSDDSNVMWQDLDETAMNQIWAVGGLDNDYAYIFNASNGKYPYASSYNNVVPNRVVLNKLKIKALGTNTGQYNLFANGDLYEDDGQSLNVVQGSSTTASQGSIYNYNVNSVDGTAAWYICEVPLTTEISKVTVSSQLTSIYSTENTAVSTLLEGNDVSALANHPQASEDALTTAQNTATTTATTNAAKAYNDLLLAVSAFHSSACNLPSVGYYRLKNIGESTSTDTYMNNAGSGLNAASNTNITTVFYLEDAGNDQFYIKADNGLYVQAFVSQNTQIKLGTTKVAHTFTAPFLGKFAIRAASCDNYRGYLHRNGGNVVGWQVYDTYVDVAGDKTLWTLSEVTGLTCYPITFGTGKYDGASLTVSTENYTGSTTLYDGAFYAIASGTVTTSELTATSTAQTATVTADETNHTIAVTFTSSEATFPSFITLSDESTNAYYYIHCAQNNSNGNHTDKYLSARSDDYMGYTTNKPTTGSGVFQFYYAGVGSNGWRQYYIYNTGAQAWVTYTSASAGQKLEQLVTDKASCKTWRIQADGTNSIDVIPGENTTNADDTPAWNVNGGFGYVTYLGLWNASGAASSWVPESVELDATALATLKNNYVKYYATNYAEHKGEIGYISDDYYTNTLEACADVTTLKSTYANRRSSINNYTVPTTGHFYEIQGRLSGHALSCEMNSSSKCTMTSTFTKDNIFYFDGQHFISYATGYRFGKDTYSMAATCQENDVITFDLSYDTDGYLTMKTNYTGSKIIYSGNASSTNCDRQGTKDSGGKTDWYFKEITKLPVTIKSSFLGYSTYSAPVAVTVPDGTSAYVCKLGTDGTTLTFYEITYVAGGKIIPANTGVLLYNSSAASADQTVDFTKTTCNETITGNALEPTAETIAWTAANDNTGTDYYSLRVATFSDDSKKVGFYLKTSGTTRAGFKAFIPTTHTSSARTFTIRFDGEDVPTGLVEALGLENENVEIYDLNGRKLQSYQKGINIVNGKKVIK